MRSADLLVLGGEVLHEPVVPLAEVWHGHVEPSIRKPVTDLYIAGIFDTAALQAETEERPTRPAKRKGAELLGQEVMRTLGKQSYPSWKTKQSICTCNAFEMATSALRSVQIPCCNELRMTLSHLLCLSGKTEDVVHHHDSLRPGTWRGIGVDSEKRDSSSPKKNCQRDSCLVSHRWHLSVSNLMKFPGKYDRGACLLLAAVCAKLCS